ncbi:hypothetical protein SCOCK_140074 [Actinacidiphila cocklensis]|uniref:Uncharacterized protein n=1 Tax=Actinacidiphila cocklensis TaxID=887465 RepID=A0A9W4DIB2_9ACTN|nr:hypothetical protein SCOCK_140074 [Actinacidiphila cocklensis]
MQLRFVGLHGERNGNDSPLTHRVPVGAGACERPPLWQPVHRILAREQRLGYLRQQTGTRLQRTTCLSASEHG